MFNSRLKTTFIAAAIAVGTLLTANAPASAEVRGGIFIGSPDLQIGFTNRHSRRGDRWERRNRCSPRRALRKARRNGVRRAYIARVGRRGVVVKGRQWGDRVVMGFEGNRRCSIRFVRGR